MNIGELAKRTGLTNSRIRFYERAGLLKTVERLPNGYRTYPPEAVLMLELITTAQNAGFSLDEIRSLLPSDLEQWDHPVLIDTLRRKVADIGRLEARLAQSKEQLVALIKDIEARPDDIDCAANARRVLSQLLGKEMERPTVTVGDVKLFGKTRRRRRPRAA
ncbi:MerR family transcriptional regulator [Bradyrhizobium brasilense]|uniref:MerR family transcriptional regulator n=1 Tax=Bradyrhizobium brasilense TaxID=1419277 RepID=UPI001456CB8A|nr:MerR family transcriptional regulator [Bradyrhizobium brasilense]NLS71584.1 MerR family transcriptional regulator [Bradyrhizobium brasilense]